MDNLKKILVDEKTRLENLCAFARQKFVQVASPGMVQKTIKNQNGEDRLISYIDLDKFTPAQKEQFDLACEKINEMRARLCVFDSFIKSNVPQATVESYNQYIPSFDEFKDLEIPCSNIELNENMEIKKYNIRVGSYSIESPRNMKFEEYAQLYTESLSKILLNSLGNGLSQEQAMKEIVNSCSDVYLNPPQSDVSEDLDSEVVR